MTSKDKQQREPVVVDELPETPVELSPEEAAQVQGGASLSSGGSLGQYKTPWKIGG